MSALDDNSPTLEQDAALDEPLRRVAYEAGMLLGLEATRDEQEYHRRRVSRHHYWLHGFGTLAGMLVAVDNVPAVPPATEDTVRVLVNPGLGIDRLGREVLVHEAYCISLGEWLAAQSEATLAAGHAAADNLLWLAVTVRHKDCAVGNQPVLARKLNLSTDAVQPSRTEDSVMLALRARLPSAAEMRYQPFGNHTPISDTDPVLSAAEQAMLDAATGEAAGQLRLHARLLHALDSGSVGAQILAHELEQDAELLLAEVSIPVTDLSAITLDATTISVNNLVRPFLVTASQLAWLARQP